MIETPERSKPTPAEKQHDEREEWATPRIFVSEMRHSRLGGSTILEPTSSTLHS
jgi:hypothetical protein